MTMMTMMMIEFSAELFAVCFAVGVAGGWRSNVMTGRKNNIPARTRSVP